MIISIKVICRKDKIYQNQTSLLFIRYTLNRKVRMLSLGININPDHWNDANQSISEECPDKVEFEAKIASKLSEYNARIKKLQESNELTLDNLFKDTQTRRYKFLDDYFLLIIDRLKSLGKYTSADKHKTVFTMIKKFHPAKIRFEEIDVIFLRDFEHFLRERKNSSNSIATKMAVLKAVYNKALAEELFEVRRSPFSKYKVGSLWKPTRKRAISKEEIHQIINLEIEESSCKDLARDIFLFSYYMAGINFGDMCHLTHGNIYKGRLCYTRRKTGKGSLQNQMEPWRSNFLHTMIMTYILSLVIKSFGGKVFLAYIKR